MPASRFARYEVDITPEAIAGVERHSGFVTTGDIVDERGWFWSQQQPDDYMPALKTALQIQWTYSKVCCFNCVHCFNNSSPSWTGHVADPFLVADRIIEARPYNVCLCGGEPLVWEHLYDIIRKLRAGGVPLVSTVTNGYLADAEAVRALHEAGLTNIQFSVDGTTPEEFMELRLKRDGLARVTAAIEECLKYDWRDLSISWSPTRNNIGSWKTFCRQWAERGVKHIRTQPLMPVGRGKDRPDLIPTDEQYQRFHMDVYDLAEELPEVFIDWGDPLEHLWFYTKTPATPWCFGIQSDGWYELSCYIPVLLASSLEHSLEEFWAKDLRRLWNAPLTRKFAEIMLNCRGMSRLELPIYDQESLHIDIFDEDQLEAFLATDDLATLEQMSRKNLAAFSDQAGGS